MRSIIRATLNLWDVDYFRWTVKGLVWIVGLAVALWYGALGMLYLAIFTMIYPWLVWPEAAIVILLLLTIIISSIRNKKRS